MNRIISVVIFLLPAVLCAQEQPSTAPVKNVNLHLRATVKAIVPLEDFSGTVTPTDFRSRFALTLHIETVQPFAKELAAGSTMTFAIHSPSLLFEGDPKKNLPYDFYLIRQTEGDNVRFLGLTTHRGCAQDDVVGFPLNGWIGYTNTGESTSDMTVTAHTGPKDAPIASATTDSTGRFSFPTLAPGKYYLKAVRRQVDAIVTADAVVKVRKGNSLIACLVAEGEATNERPLQ